MFFIDIVTEKFFDFVTYMPNIITFPFNIFAVYGNF